MRGFNRIFGKVAERPLSSPAPSQEILELLKAALNLLVAEEMTLDGLKTLMGW